jgi:hypothetical protein
MIASWLVSFPKQAKKIADVLIDPRFSGARTSAAKSGAAARCKKDTWVPQSNS